MTKRKLILILLIIVGIVFILYLATSIIYKIKLLNSQVIIPISGNNTIRGVGSKLKKFYEPRPNSTETEENREYYKGTYTINSDALNERFNY